MKAEARHRQVTPSVAGWASKGLLSLVFFFFLQGSQPFAQCKFGQINMQPGEKIDYDIYFKWGILNPKAGSAQISYSATEYNQKDAYLYKLIFKTAGIAEKVYKTRDTLTNVYSSDHILLKAAKHTREKDRYNIDETTFDYRQSKTYARMRRYDLTRTKADTTYTVDGCLLDMLSSTFFVRNIDWEKLKPEDSFSATIVSGKSLVKIIIRYKGQRILEISENVKYNTCYFSIEVDDKTFESNSTELWMSDDKNHIPLKIKTKLSIGAAEVYYNSSKGLQYPLTSIIKIKRR